MRKEPYAGMSKKKNKAETLYLKDEKEWWEEELENQKKGAVFFEGIYFGKVPLELLRDPKVKLQAKAIYALMHSYSQPKRLISKPKTFVSQKRLAKDVGLSDEQIRYWLKKLEESGWLKVLRRGLNKTNYYILYAKKRK